MICAGQPVVEPFDSHACVWEATLGTLLVPSASASRGRCGETRVQFTKAEIDAEYAKNKAIGERTGCWKAGVLVEDDSGSVALALKELNQ
jgi:hypothetical protein